MYPCVYERKDVSTSTEKRSLFSFLEASGCGLMIICHVPLRFIRSKNSIKHSSPLTLRYLILTHFIRRGEGKNKTFDTDFLRRSLYQRGTLIIWCALEQLRLLFVSTNTVFSHQEHLHLLPEPTAASLPFARSIFCFNFPITSVFVKDRSTHQRQLMAFVSFCSFTSALFVFFFLTKR